jgi:hypothetical protein
VLIFSTPKSKNSMSWEDLNRKKRNKVNFESKDGN